MAHEVEDKSYPTAMPVSFNGCLEENVVDPLAQEAATYQGKFKHYLKRSLVYMQQIVQEAGPILPERDGFQAIHLLGYALREPEVWLDTRALLLTLAPTLEQAGFHEEWTPYLEKGIALSQTLGDDAAVAELTLHLGYLWQLRSQQQDAQHCFMRSAALFEAHGDKHNLARALNRLAFLAHIQHAATEGIAFAQRALALLSADDPERAASFIALGWHAYDQRNWAQAAGYFEDALTLWQQQGNQRQIARCLRDRASALQMQGQYPEAMACYEKAIALFADLPDPYAQAVARMNLGVVYLFLAQAETALRLFVQAEPIFQRVQDLHHLAMLHNNYGIAQRALGDWEAAEHSFLASLDLNEQISNRNELINVADELGLTYLQQGKVGLALAYFQKALAQLNSLEPGPVYTYWDTKIRRHLQTMQTETASQPAKLG